MSCLDQTNPTIAPIKRGDSFNMSCIYKENGTPANLTQYTINSQLRDSGDNLVQALLVTKADQSSLPGAFVLSAIDTSVFPIDLLRCDIQFVEGETTRSTQTFFIPVEEDVTR